MNFFSSDAFLLALGEVFFPGRPRQIDQREAGGLAFRLLAVNGRPITHFPFLDFLEPIPHQQPRSLPSAGYLPRALLGVVTAEEWRRLPPRAEVEPCPFVQWSLFPTWADFAPRLPQQGTAAQRRRKLERELGPLCFREHDSRPQALAACLGWKSAQYRSTGFPDTFADRRYLRLFQQLFEKGALTVSSLSAGGRLAAVHICPRWPGRASSWVPAFDPGLARYTPGKLLLEAMLEWSLRRGDREFDFLIGGEEYKFHYATHVRVAGPWGEIPFSLRLKKGAKEQLKRALGHLPWIEAPARELYRALGRRALLRTGAVAAPAPAAVSSRPG